MRHDLRVRRRDLLHQLSDLVGDLEGVVVADVRAEEHLAALVRAARLAFGAAGVSVASATSDGLRYVAADGAGADAIVGTLLPFGRGLAGYVALSGQALAVDRTDADPRFARDVAEATGYVPTTLLVVPASGPGGEVVGVLSVLDRTVGGSDALALGSAFAAQAALVLPQLAEVGRAVRAVADAVVAALSAGDRELADALHRVLARRSSDDDQLVARTAAVLADVRRADPEVRERLVGVLAEVASMATARRRR